MNILQHASLLTLGFSIACFLIGISKQLTEIIRLLRELKERK